MKSFQAAHASAPNWLQAAERCLDQIGDIQPEANLGFLYVSDRFDSALPEILAYFKDRTSVEHWTGSVGVAVLGQGREYYEPAVSVMLAAFPPDSFRTIPAIRFGMAELPDSCRAWCERAGARFAVVHGDPRNPRTPLFIAELAEALNEGFLVGGITSARHHPWQIAEEVTDGGLSGVAFAGDIPVTTALTQGCTPTGKPHEITECQGNIVIRLDERPALDVFYEDIGEVLSRDPARAAGYIFAGLPIQGSDTGDYLVRNILALDIRHRAIAIGEPLSAGDTLMFCRRDPRTAYEDLVRMLRDIKRHCPHPPKGGVYYSCLGRGQHTFGNNSEELRTIQQELGDIPLSGFFANGEISHNRLYGFTGVLTLFL